MKACFPSLLHKFIVRMDIPKDTPIYDSEAAGSALTFQMPISAKPDDLVWADLARHKVEIIARGGIVIWRSGWLN